MRLLSCLFCLFTLAAYGQNTNYYSEGKSDPEALRGLIKERGYQALSEFDTVSIDPVLIYAIYFKNNKMGLLDHTGKEITPAVYDRIPGLDKSRYENQNIYHKFWTVVKNKRFGLIDRAGKIVFDTKYRNIVYVKTMSGKRFVDRFYEAWDDDGRIEIINTSGIIEKVVQNVGVFDEPEEVYPMENYNYNEYPVYEMENSKQTGKYGQLWQRNFPPYFVFKNIKLKKFGLMNVATGDTLIPFIYDWIGINKYFDVQLMVMDSARFNAGYYTRKELHGLADTNGNILFEPVYKKIDRIDRVFQVVNHQDNMALYSLDGKALSAFIYGPQMHGRNGDYMVLRKGLRWGLVTMQGKAVTPFDYDGFSFISVFDSPTPIIIVGREWKEAIMDHSGKLLCPFTYSRIIPEVNVQAGGSGTIKLETYFIARRPNQYYFIASGIHDVKNSLRYGIMDTNYNELVPCQYSHMIKCNNPSFAIVRKDSLWGILNIETNTYLVEPEIEHAPKEMNPSCFLYRINGKYRVLNEGGKIVVPFIEEKEFNIELTFNGLAKVTRHDGYTVYYDFLGNRVLVGE